MDGVNYFHVKVVGLLFVATTRVNVSPSLVLELLQRIARVIKDYLGVLNEDSLRRNFVLVYELLDEVIVSSFHMFRLLILGVVLEHVFNFLQDVLSGFLITAEVISSIKICAAYSVG